MWSDQGSQERMPERDVRREPARRHPPPPPPPPPPFSSAYIRNNEPAYPNYGNGGLGNQNEGNRNQGNAWDDPNQVNLYKIDVCFYNGCKKVKSRLNLSIILHSVKLVCFIAFLVVMIVVPPVYQATFPYIFIGLGLASSIAALINAIHEKVTAFGHGILNQIPLLSIAHQLDHEVLDQPLEAQNVRDISDCVSQKVYRYMDNTPVGSQKITQDVKKADLQYMTRVIKASYKIQQNKFRNIVRTLSIAAIVFGVFAIAGRVKEPQTIGIAVAGLVLMLLANWKFMLLFLIGISICVLFVPFLLLRQFCLPRQKQFLNMESFTVSVDMIRELKGQKCKICHRSFRIGQQINKYPQCGHTFHTQCLTIRSCFFDGCKLCKQNQKKQQHK